MSVPLALLASSLPPVSYVDPIGAERFPCECVEPCTDCNGLGCEDEPLYPADFVVGLDALRRELDRSYPEPVCLGCGVDCESMHWPPEALPSAFCSGCDPTLMDEPVQLPLPGERSPCPDG